MAAIDRSLHSWHHYIRDTTRLPPPPEKRTIAANLVSEPRCVSRFAPSICRHNVGRRIYSAHTAEPDEASSAAVHLWCASNGNQQYLHLRLQSIELAVTWSFLQTNACVSRPCHPVLTPSSLFFWIQTSCNDCHRRHGCGCHRHWARIPLPSLKEKKHIWLRKPFVVMRQGFARKTLEARVIVDIRVDNGWYDGKL